MTFCILAFVVTALSFFFFRERLTRDPNSPAKKFPSLDTEEANLIHDPAHRGTVDFCRRIARAGVKGGIYIGWCIVQSINIIL